MADVENLYKQYFQDVYLFVLKLSRDRHIAEEITQETFVKALSHLDTFQGQCKISVWLCQIAKNTYFTYRSKQKRIVSFDVSKGVQAEPDQDLEQKLVNKAETLKIHKLIHDLKEPYKEVFTLRVFGELSFAQISQIFGRTESWARVTFHRARGILQELMEEDV